MKINIILISLTVILVSSSLKASAQNSKTDLDCWAKTSLPPTGYEPKKNSPSSRYGKSLYEKRNCASCHQISSKGGTMGPPLDGIGGHRGEQFLIERLQNPLKQSLEYSELFGGKPGLMPHTGLNRRQAGAIAKYLLTLPEPAEGFFIQAHGEKEDSVQTTKSSETPGTRLGAELFIEHGCAACHTTYDDDPRFGPSLKGIGQRKSREEIEKLLSGKFKNRLMKKQAEVLDPQEIRCLTDFLLKMPAPKQ